MNLKLYISGLFLVCSIAVSARDTDVILKESIQKVTVFQSSAQIESAVKTSIAAGSTQLIISDLPENLQANSVQVSGTGNFTILSVESKRNFLTTRSKSSRVRVLEDSLNRFEYLLEMENIRKYALDQEESLLLSNKTLTNKDNTAVDVEDMAELFRTRLPKIRTEQFAVGKEIKRLTQIVQSYQAEISRTSDRKVSSDIVVEVSSNSGGNVTLNIKYLVTNVYWVPKYDIRVKDTHSPIELNFKADVVQNTGVDWNNIKLVLSTGNPTRNNTVKPELAPWYVSLQDPRAPRPLAYQEKSMEADIQQMPTRSANSLLKAAAGVAVTMQQGQFSQNYEIMQAYTVPTDGNAKTVEIGSYQMPCVYEYAATPKLDEKVYLLGKIYDWEKFNLLPASANIFFEGSFVGESQIDPFSVEDTLSVSLGSDKSIVIKREKVNEESSRKTIGSTRKMNLGYEITLRNTKAMEVSLKLEDHVPVSQDKSLEIKMTDLGDAQYDAATGQLKWTVKLAPNESKKIRYSYELKYPKDKTLAGF
jgi:uncharacterized protein (TIGR02231 family)